MINPYLAILLTLAGSILLAFGLIFGTSLIGPKVTSRVKSAPFESGAELLTPVKRTLSVKFYLIAALFVMFDIEVIFLYPWAVYFRDLGMLGFVAMSIFLFILTVGLVYEWKKGALET